MYRFRRRDTDVGIARCNRVRTTETILFEKGRASLDEPERFNYDFFHSYSRRWLSTVVGDRSAL